jgi:hypothetical protein
VRDFGDFEGQGDGGLEHDDLLDAMSMALHMVNPYEAGFASGEVFEAAGRSSGRAEVLRLTGEWRSAP